MSHKGKHHLLASLPVQMALHLPPYSLKSLLITRKLEFNLFSNRTWRSDVVSRYLGERVSE